MTNHPNATSPQPLPYAVGRPRRQNLHLWLAAAVLMVVELPWVWVVSNFLWEPMSGGSGLDSLRGVFALAGLSFPSLAAAALVLLAIIRS